MKINNEVVAARRPPLPRAAILQMQMTINGFDISSVL